MFDTDKDPATPCEACKPGSYMNTSTKASTCFLCPAGKFDDDQKVSTRCADCRKGTESPVGARQCLRCGEHTSKALRWRGAENHQNTMSTGGGPRTLHRTTF